MTVTLPGLAESSEACLHWGNETLRIAIAHGPNTAPRLVALWHGTEPTPDLDSLRRSALPVLELAVLGEGRHGTAGKRHVDGAVAPRLRLLGHREEQVDGGLHLQLRVLDEFSGLRADVHYELAAQSPVLRTWAEISTGRQVTLDYASTGVVAGGHRHLRVPS